MQHRRFQTLVALIALCWLAGPAKAATHDLSGAWEMTYLAGAHTGVCPAGHDFTGAVTIEQTGDAFTLSITSGTECQPAFTCVFSGTIDGDHYVGENSGSIPNDGGVVSNEMTFDAESADAASGFGLSSWNTGTCTWESTFVLTRTGGGPDDPGDDDSGGCATAGTGSLGLLLAGLACLGLRRRK